MPAKFNYKRIAEKIIASPVGLKKFENAVGERFEDAKADFIQEFENHVVSREIETSSHSPDADNNLSGTLGGKGNLWSFIGFEKGDNPIGKVSGILRLGMTTARSKVTGFVKNGRPAVNYRFSVKIPREELINQTQMEWEPVSWLYQIERKISGFTHYIRGAFEQSRSGGGLQVKKNAVRSAEYKPPVGGYFQTLFRNFAKNFKLK